MAEDIRRIPASKQLRDVAKTEWENKLEPINEYKGDSFEYGATNENALSNNDEKGKGETTTGIGSKTDISERIRLLNVNMFNNDKPYTSPE
jgi:hypothetical protein